MSALFLYILFLGVFSWVQKSNWSHEVFQTQKKISWFVSGISLFMLNLSVDQGQLISGIIAKHGLSGMWIFWAGWLGVFVVPIVFAPLWKKLNFKTDNEFLLFRYPGNAGKFLYLFRALYVGFLVASFAVSFHVLGFSRILQVYFSISEPTAIFFSGLLLCCFALKNVLDLKIKTDFVHGVLYLVSFLLIYFLVWNVSGGLDSVEKYFELHPGKNSVFPIGSQSEKFSFLVILGIQWWSVYLFDGGGAETSRFVAVDEPRKVIWAALLPVLVSLVTGIFMLLLVLMILGNSPIRMDAETNFVQQIFMYSPDEIDGLILIGFFGVFIAVSESLLNWGASFITLDVFMKSFPVTITKKKERILSFLIMVFMATCASLFAFQMKSLEIILKYTFSIAAGVAPVYILRWIWFRINAWSQLSAMLCSAICTIVYPSFHAQLPLANYPLEESRVLVVTLTTTAVWVAVTFLNSTSDLELETKMLKVIGSRILFTKRLLLALGLGICLLSLLIFTYWIIFS